MDHQFFGSDSSAKNQNQLDGFRTQKVLNPSLGSSHRPVTWVLPLLVLVLEPVLAQIPSRYRQAAV